jgi:hypothetical protein
VNCQSARALHAPTATECGGPHRSPALPPCAIGQVQINAGPYARSIRCRDMPCRRLCCPTRTSKCAKPAYWLTLGCPRLCSIRGRRGRGPGAIPDRSQPNGRGRSAEYQGDTGLAENKAFPGPRQPVLRQNTVARWCRSGTPLPNRISNRVLWHPTPTPDSGANCQSTLQAMYCAVQESWIPTTGPHRSVRAEVRRHRRAIPPRMSSRVRHGPARTKAPEARHSRLLESCSLFQIHSALVAPRLPRKLSKTRW